MLSSARRLAYGVPKRPGSIRWFADISPSSSAAPPARRSIKRGTGISIQEREALRAARKERAAKFLEEQGVEGAVSSKSRKPVLGSRMTWYLGLGLPTAIITWGFVDKDSPPAQFSKLIGLTDFIRSYTDEIAKPAHEKLLPDWSQVRVEANQH